MSGDWAFKQSLIKFLRQLEKNNNRTWFQENKTRYESDVLSPALEFIDQMSVPLRKISRHFKAVPKRSGGSLMRVYRDTRFSKDKTPYKTNVGIQFRHELGKDVHAPGYYFHIDPNSIFVGVGIWHPENKTLAKIRDYIADNPSEWKRIKKAKRFKDHLELSGTSLKRPPRGYDPEHVHIEDLKRKDFIAVANLPRSFIYDKDLINNTTTILRSGTPLMRFLCEAIEVQF